MDIICPICMLVLSAYQMLESIGVCDGWIGVSWVLICQMYDLIHIS